MGGVEAFSGAGLFVNGVYALTATATQVTAALDAVSFALTAGAQNTQSFSIFTLTDISSAETDASDNQTSMTDADPAVGPTISGTITGQATAAGGARQRFRDRQSRGPASPALRTRTR